MSDANRCEPTPSELAAPALGDRSLFPDLEHRAYLNHAAISPPSTAVAAAVREALDGFGRRGVAAYLEWHQRRQRLRGALAAMIGAQPGDLGFVGNTTEGVRAIALCLPWQAGDRVVLFGGEFPANTTPWLQAAQLYDLEVVWLPQAEWAADEAQALQRLEDELRRGARLVAVSAVAFQTGLRLPVAAMAACCHAHGAELFVDAIQACGVVPVDVVAEGIDYLAAGGHKWLMGPAGTGLLYVAPERIGALRPVVAGWTSHEDGMRFLFEGAGLLRYDRPVRARADFVEGGMVPILGYAGLEPAVELLGALGVEAIFEHVGRYLDALEEGLVARGFRSLRAAAPEQRSGILAVHPPAPWEAIALAPRLGERGIACSTPDGLLRFAPHWPNGLGEVEVVLGAVDEVCGV